MEMNRELIEKEDWAYALYKTGEQYELSIVVASPAPGFDVFHVLNEEEVAGYQAHGMDALQERIGDMERNLTQYKHQSWR